MDRAPWAAWLFPGAMVAWIVLIVLIHVFGWGP
jgi:hypothetical protein